MLPVPVGIWGKAPSLVTKDGNILGIGKVSFLGMSTLSLLLKIYF